jgi:hypothetical protein
MTIYHYFPFHPEKIQVMHLYIHKSSGAQLVRSQDCFKISRGNLLSGL